MQSVYASSQSEVNMMTQKSCSQHRSQLLIRSPTFSTMATPFHTFLQIFNMGLPRSITIGTNRANIIFISLVFVSVHRIYRQFSDVTNGARFFVTFDSKNNSKSEHIQCRP